MRRYLLALALLLCVALSGYIAYRQLPWLRGLFASDNEDPVEMTKLADKRLEIASVAEGTTGWSQWRGPLRDGRAPDGPFRTDWDKRPPKLLWSSPCGGGFSSLAVVAGKVYTQDRKGGNERVICLNAEDGKLLWEYGYSSESAGTDTKYAIGPRATPTVHGNKVYTVGGAGKLLCLEAASEGTEVRVCWQHDLLPEFEAAMPQWGVACSPLVEGNLVVVQPGGKKGSVTAFDKQSGELRWTAGSQSSGYSSPIAATIGGERTIFVLTATALHAIDMAGKVTASYSWETRFGGNVATPLCVDDYIFISAAYGQGCALLRAVRKEDGVKFIQVYARHRKGLQNHHSTSVYLDRYLFGFDGDSVGRLKCIEFNTGNEKADWDAPGAVKGSLILAGKHLIIQTERGELWLVEARPDEFRLVAKIPKVLSGNNSWATPSLVEGRLYLRDEEKIVCYDVSP